VKTPIHALLGFFGAHFPQKMSLIVLTPKGPSLGGTTSFEPYRMNIGRTVRACEEEKKDSTGQDRKTVTKGLYFTYWEKPPPKRSTSKIV